MKYFFFSRPRLFLPGLSVGRFRVVRGGLPSCWTGLQCEKAGKCARKLAIEGDLITEQNFG